MMCWHIKVANFYLMWTEIWSELPPEVLRDFESQSRTIDVKRGDPVYRQGDEPKGIYFVKRGLIGLVIIGQNSGKDHLMRFFRDGQFFGHRALFSDEGYHGSTVALEPSELRLVPKSVIHRAVDMYPHLLKNVVRILSKELRRCENNQVMILENEILGRVAQSLVYLKDLHPDHNWTRQEIANFCASTVSTVIKTMAELEKRGFIIQEGRSISILDKSGLIAINES